MVRQLSASLALGLGLTLSLVACNGPAGGKNVAANDAGGKAVRVTDQGGKDPYIRLIAHTDTMLKILKDNREDPDKAIRELTAYQEKNEAELQKLKQEVADLMQKDAMKVAAPSAVYGMRSAELDMLTTEVASRRKPQ